MSAQVLSVKLFDKGEFRRFGIELQANEDVYAQLLAKVQSMLPGFDGSLAWKDRDGDLIVVSSSAELQEALRALGQGEVLRIFTSGSFKPQSATKGEATATDASEENKDPKLHVGISCDGCQGSVRGIRYKCLDCPDYDLCAECEPKQLHEQHTFLRIADPANRDWRAAYWLNRHRQNSPGHRHHGHWGPEAAAWWAQHRGYPRRGRCDRHHECKKEGSAENEAKAEATAANASTEQATSTDAGLAFLNDIGDQVAAALSNIGIKVDADTTNRPQTSAQPPQQFPNSMFASTLAQLTAMGFGNEGGWLERLVEEKHGNINAVLNALHPRT